MMMRRIAETCESFEAARQIILGSPPGMPFIITVSAAKSRRFAVFERNREHVRERVPKNQCIAADNTAHPDADRVTSLMQVVNGVMIRDVDDIESVLSHPDVMLLQNLYSVIFDYQQNRLLISSGKTPAAVEEYREYRLF